jgi:glycine oxidase
MTITPAFSATNSFDVIIVGNGILGLSTGYMLALEDPNIKIGIIGSSDQQGGATVASGAMLGCFGEVTYSTMQSTPGCKKFEMNFQASQMWPRWVEQINEKVSKENHLHVNNGTFVILNSRSGDLDNKNYKAITNALEFYKQPYSKEEANNIPGLNPIDDCRPMKALYLPNEGTINPLLLLKNLTQIIKELPNVSLIEGSIQKICSMTDKIKTVQTKCERKFQTHHLVITAGAYSQEIIDQIPEIKNRIPRIFYGVGCSVLVEKEEMPINHLVRTPNRSFACGLHILPRDKKTFYIGATNNVGLFPETTTNVGSIHFLLQCAMEQVNQGLHNAKILQLIAGNRPVTIDTFPLVGETSIKGLWLLTGTYRDGLHSAPYLANHIVKKILGSKEDLFENIFQPERRPLQIFSREEAIQDAMQHYMAGAYEHLIKLPRVGWDLMFQEMLHRKFEDL